MQLPTPLPAPLVELISERFRLLGEPTRIAALDHLRSGGEDSVGGIATALGTSQQNVSKHLAALHQGGVLARRKEGNRVLYSFADAGVLEMCELVCEGLRRQLGELESALEGARA